VTTSWDTSIRRTIIYIFACLCDGLVKSWFGILLETTVAFAMEVIRVYACGHRMVDALAIAAGPADIHPNARIHRGGAVILVLARRWNEISPVSLTRDFDADRGAAELPVRRPSWIAIVNNVLPKHEVRYFATRRLLRMSWGRYSLTSTRLANLHALEFTICRTCCTERRRLEANVASVGRTLTVNMLSKWTRCIRHAGGNPTRDGFR
jgi:hypothetical protein